MSFYLYDQSATFKPEMIKIQTDNFPAGETRFVDDFQCGNLKLFWLYESDEELFVLLAIASKFHQFNIPLNLTIPYLPHARMDRVKSDKEYFTLKYFANFINKMIKPVSLTVYDVHSDVALALFDCPVHNENLHDYMNMVIFQSKMDDKLIVYPDYSSFKRYDKFFAEHPNRIYFHKSRNFKTGKIEQHTMNKVVDFNFENKKFDVFMIDDICSYGNTFLSAANMVKDSFDTNEINLLVTHCEKSVYKGDLLKPDSPLNGKIYTSYSLQTQSEMPEKVVINTFGYQF